MELARRPLGLSCGLNGFNTGGIDPPHCPDPTEPDRTSLFFFYISLPKVFGLVGPVWQDSAAQREPRLTEAGICQRSWQHPMGVRLKEEEGKESDVEEEGWVRSDIPDSTWKSQRKS